MVNGIMGYVTSTSYVVLINGSTYSFFKPSKGLREGFPLSPYLFLLVTEGLSKSILDSKRNRSIHGIKVEGNEFITHLFL